MRNIKTRGSPRVRKKGEILAAVSILALVLTSVASPASAVEQSTVAMDSTSAGSSLMTAVDVQIIDGVLFGMGPVADSLGNSVSALFSSPDDLAIVEANLQSARDAFLEVKEPEADAAVEKIRSGSVNTVTAGLEQLGQSFNDYIKETYTEEELASAVQNYGGVAVVPMCGVVAACAAAVAVAVYAGVIVQNAAAITAATAVVVAAALWCGAWTWCGRSAPTEGNERVLQEKFIAHLTRVSAALPE
ncbi:hypothetical protein [Leifsonia xyli]|uniref:hypothetical protein n=1 Tax=Leifsonia xyli TaxID=1575 RepID=UPI00114CD677|nr:hypothetical protein [Leifsonia xyli]